MKFCFSIFFLLLCFILKAQHNQVVKLESLVGNSELIKADSLLPYIKLNNLTDSSRIKFCYLKGRIDMQLDRLEEASDSFLEGAMLLGPSNISEQAFDFCYYRGIVARELRHWDSAREQIARGRHIANKLENKTFLYESDFLQSNLHNYLNEPDSAAYYLDLAKGFVSSNDYLKLSKIESNLGVLHMDMKNFENALSFFKQALNLREKLQGTSSDHYGQLFINMADCYLELNMLEEGQEFMTKALAVAEKKDNRLQLAQVLRLKIKFISLRNGFPEIAKLDELADDLEHEVIDSTVHEISIKHNVQFKDTQIVEQGKVIKKTEKAALNRLKGIFVLGISMLGSLLLFYFYNKNQKIKHELALSKEIIQKQEALANERTRIAAEMHDDLGGGLTKIKFLGQKMLRKTNDIEQKEKLNKIVLNSQTLVTNMSEIIWAMNPGFDTLDNLIAYSRRFTSEYLSDHEIKLSFTAEESNQKIEFSGEKRRHVFLVYKELLHNIVKHANATEVSVDWKIMEDNLRLSIKDNGVGMNSNLDDEELGNSGNGLRNMRMRIEKLGGSIYWSSTEGLTTEMQLPLGNKIGKNKLN